MIAAIIQARMDSRRFPGKTMVDICGKPLLAHVIERIHSSRLVEKIVVATTDRSEDGKVIDLARHCEVLGFAGSADDVLDRYYQAAITVSADFIVRVTADDPLRDPEVMDRAIEVCIEEANVDYVSTDNTFPEGAGCEVVAFKALETAWCRAKLPSEREHVTPFILNHPDRFSVRVLKGSRDLSRFRWTVDYPQDLIFIREIYHRLYRGQVFGMDDIVALLEDEPWLCDINSGIGRYEGYTRSLEQDAAFLKEI